MKTSRLLGALVGGLGGAAVGFGATFALYGTDFQGGLSLFARIMAGLAVGAVGALLGALFGVTPE
jgi:hypothetical protein